MFHQIVISFRYDIRDAASHSLIIASPLIQKGIMSSSAPSKMLVKCDYCGKEMLKKNLKDHTNSIHGPNKAPRERERQISGQSQLSFVKRKADNEDVEGN